MYGMDLSNYQAKIDLTKGDYQFCIIKATEGIGYTDKSFRSFAVQLTKLNKLIGCYHFARPDFHPTIEQMKQEAEYFIKEVKDAGLLGKSILVLDWEKEPFDREDLITSWLERVKELTGQIPFIYGSKSKLTNWQRYSFMTKYPIWMALYPSIKEYYIGAELPKIIDTKFSYNIWQYSSNGKYPNYSSKIDLDWSDMTWNDWTYYCMNLNETEKEKISQDMHWAIDNGIFVGDGEGHYFPKDYITREQTATVLRKLYDLLIEGSEF